MNDVDTLTTKVGYEIVEIIENFFEADIQNFGDQVKFLGLDPKNDFRYSDLSFISFDHCDLRGYDFTGANLSGTTGVGAVWDGTTKLKGANIIGSLFSYVDSKSKFLKENPHWEMQINRLKRSHWTKSIIWVADNISRTGKNRREMIEVGKALFTSSSDALLQSNTLYFLSYAFDNATEHRDFMFHVINDYWNNIKIVKSAISVLSTLYSGDKSTVCLLYGLAKDCKLNSEIRRLALRGLINSGYFLQALEYIMNDDVLSAVDLRRQFTRRVASQRGSFAIDCVTEPRGDICLDFMHQVNRDKIILISRRIARQNKIENRKKSQDNSANSFSIEPSYYEYMNLAVTVRDEIIKIRDLGLPISLSHDVGELKKIDYDEYLRRHQQY